MKYITSRDLRKRHICCMYCQSKLFSIS